MNTPIAASLSAAILNRVRPPSGLLARIRWLFLLCALFNVVAVAPLLLRGEVGSPPMRVAGFLGAAVLVLWWSRGYGRHRFPIRGLLIEMVALTAVCLALQTPDEALGIIYCGLYFRALYARWRDALPLLLVFAASYLAPTLIGPMIQLPMTEIVQQTIGFVVSTSVMTFVAAVGRSHERAAAREAALARAGVALMAATDQDQVSVVTLDSVRELLGEVSVRRTDLRLDGFPATFEVPETMTRVGTVTLTPLRAAGAPMGVLVVESPQALPEECASALATLTAEAGLAIANIRLTDDLRRDIAERKALEGELAHRAFHDPLTELPNRALLVERLHHALARTRRSVRRPAVIFIDLDDFKVVNDSLGHRLGDDLLVMVSQRLRAAIRPGDTAARLGGDEFVVLLEDVADADEATQIVERFVTRLQAPFVLEGRELFVGASLGIALAQGEASLPDDLLREADLAMYSAKSKGKRRYEVFERSLENQPLERLALESDLRRAVERDELRLHYQPILELESGELCGVEALLRWEHPNRGLIPPAAFIPLAEATGLIVPIGRWVLRQACLEMKEWHDAHPESEPLTVSVNLSARQFLDPALVQDVESALEEAGLQAAYLKLEITESTAMEAGIGTIETLLALKGLGVQLAIDDFGTGYSSLSYLKRFPVDTLKIDRSFVDGLGQDPQDSAIVRSVIALARSLSLAVTAEGVETLTQLRELRDLACDEGQGYLFARPQPSVGAALLNAMHDSDDDDVTRSRAA